MAIAKKKAVRRTAKKKPVKKSVKKISKKRVTKKEKELSLALANTQQRADDLAEKLNKALVVENKKALTKAPFDLKVLLKMAEKTPAQFVRTRKGTGGKQFKYVTGGYMKTSLNYLFGWRWDFEIVDKGEVKVKDKIVQVWVQGKLTIKDEKNQPIISKTQFGGATVKYLKTNTSMPVDMANDYKASATDALKKCASEIGVASDIYNSNEFIEEGYTNNADDKNDDVIVDVNEDIGGVDYLKKLVSLLAVEAGVNISDGITKDKLEIMIEVYNNYTGENIKSLKVVQSTAEKYLNQFLNCPKMLKK